VLLGGDDVIEAGDRNGDVGYGAVLGARREIVVGQPGAVTRRDVPQDVEVAASVRKLEIIMFLKNLASSSG
jgi:hypothetical protein